MFSMSPNSRQAWPAPVKIRKVVSSNCLSESLSISSIKGLYSDQALLVVFAFEVDFRQQQLALAEGLGHGRASVWSLSRPWTAFSM